MRVQDKTILICNCEGTMPLQADKIASALGTNPGKVCNHLCRSQIAKFRAAVAEGESPLLVSCTQEAPLFQEIASETENAAPLHFVNIRERAGWSEEAAQASPKIAALIAAALVAVGDTPAVTLTSEGRLLIYGEAGAAITAAEALADELQVTCVVTDGSADHLPPTVSRYPLFQGRMTRLEGTLGRFNAQFAFLAPADVSARKGLSFGAPQADPNLALDLILDVTGGVPLAPGADLRDGYHKVDPGAERALADAVQSLRGMVGEFEKPRYVDIVESLCAHSRNKITGCTKCLDACPSGAIRPDGDRVAIDPFICVGHGACAAACPTGAIRYDYPVARGGFERLRRMMTVYHKAGGTDPILLIHDDKEGDTALGLLARQGAGLPAKVLPFPVNAVAATGLDVMLTALAYGAAQVVILCTDPRADLVPLQAALSQVDRIMDGLGYGNGRVRLLVEADPLAVGLALYAMTPDPAPEASAHQVLGRGREAVRQALTHLHAKAAQPVDQIPLAVGAPFGALEVNTETCTLCLSCVGACPAGALADHKDRPQLRFLEESCVQCGICRATCPEKAITLLPRVRFDDAGKRFAVMKEEEPFECVSCGKPFGTKSTIERIKEKVAGNPMFQDPGRIRLLEMCDDCRVIAQTEQRQPLAMGTVPKPRTTDDYLREKEKG
ncbi:MAG: 4Fe-4S dicluster domain-containing protein [Magnetospiraceae bacterium]